MDKPVLASDAIDKTGAEPKVKRLIDIPTILFKEISRHLCEGAEELIWKADGQYQWRRLIANHRYTGFAGAIGLRIIDEAAYFVIWGRHPEPADCEYAFEPPAVLRIRAGSVQGGVWTCTRGNLICEAITAELFFHGGLNLEWPCANLISMIIMRASQLARDPACVKQAYWDGYGDKP